MRLVASQKPQTPVAGTPVANQGGPGPSARRDRATSARARLRPTPRFGRAQNPMHQNGAAAVTRLLEPCHGPPPACRGVPPANPAGWILSATDLATRATDFVRLRGLTPSSWIFVRPVAGLPPHLGPLRRHDGQTHRPESRCGSRSRMGSHADPRSTIKPRRRAPTRHAHARCSGAVRSRCTSNAPPPNRVRAPKPHTPDRAETSRPQHDAASTKPCTSAVLILAQPAHFFRHDRSASRPSAPRQPCNSAVTLDKCPGQMAGSRPAMTVKATAASK